MKPILCLCGAKPKVVKDGSPTDFDYRVVCPRCGMRCPNMGRNEEDAIETWNQFMRNLQLGD